MIHRISIIVFIFMLASCAIQVAPTGGTKDTTPPKITKQYPPNYSTDFKGHDLSISFDEYIQVKDLNSQLVVSPPLRHVPETKQHKRTLLIHLEDTLIANTTYTLNFGNAIADNDEGNVLENFQYVFSTGPVLDSLSVQGKVENAFDAKTDKDIFVMLYRDTIDSIPFKERPLYFAKTTADGSFNIRNISPGRYKLFALQETNGNYLYEGSDEQIAFADTIIPAQSSGLLLHLFRERTSFRLLRSYSEEPGKAVFAFSHAADSIPFKVLNDSTALKVYAWKYSEHKDTLVCWYNNLQADSIQILFSGISFQDTANVRLLRFNPATSSKKNFVLSALPNVSPGAYLDRHLAFEVIFSHPIRSAGLDSVRLKEDTTWLKNLRLHFADSLHLHLEIDTKWKDGASYTLFIPAGCFRDIYDLSNDTITLDFKTHEQKDYGSVAIHFKSANAGSHYVLQLVDEKEVVCRESVLAGDSLIQFTGLDPHLYRLKLIYDKNKNSRWDTGDYLHHVQPERVKYYPESITVRANWDVDIKWDAKESIGGAEINKEK